MISTDTTDLKFFLYYSDLKMDMLHEQISSKQHKRVSIEWKIDAKVASVVRRSEVDKRLARYEKLQTVVKALENADAIGTIDEPRAYFRGELRMRWGLFQDTGRPEDTPPLVYFGGKTRRTIFGLGGSSCHVLGLQGATSTGGRSSAPYLVGALLKGLGINTKGWDSFGEAYESTEYNVMTAVSCATHTLRPPDQQLEFVAKTLVQGRVRHALYTKDKRLNCILGTPLYVALVSPGWNDRL